MKNRDIPSLFDKKMDFFYAHALFLKETECVLIKPIVVTATGHFGPWIFRSITISAHTISAHQNQNQNSLLVIRQTDNYSPGGATVGKSVPSSPIISMSKNYDPGIILTNFQTRKIIVYWLRVSNDNKIHILEYEKYFYSKTDFILLMQSIYNCNSNIILNKKRNFTLIYLVISPPILILGI